MRVLFGVCGIGQGHSVRASRIMDSLAKRGHEVYVLTSDDGIAFFKKKGYPLYYVRPSFSFKWTSSGLSIKNSVLRNAKNVPLFINQPLDEEYVIKKVSPDVVVVDSRLSTCLAAKRANVPSLVITNQISIFTNSWSFNKLALRILPRIWSVADRIVVPDIPPPYTISYWNVIYPLAVHRGLSKKVAFAGLLMDYDEVKINDVGGAEGREFDVVFYISAPYIDKKMFTHSVIKCIKLLSGSYKIAVILGDLRYKGRVWRGGNVSVIGWADDPLSTISAGKVVVLRGGHTSILESILSGTPMVVVPAKSQYEQIENARRVRHLNLGQSVLPANGLDLCSAIRSGIEAVVSEYDLYYKSVMRVRDALVKASGVKGVVDLITSLPRGSTR